MPRSAARRPLLGLVGRGLLVAVGVLVALALALPLLFRGALLARVITRATAPLCGSVRLESATVSPTAVFAFLLGRAVRVEVDGLTVVAPDGEEVAAVPRVAADVVVRRSPWRIEVVDVTVARARWKLIEHGGRVDMMEAFRPIPAGGSRADCLAPRRRPVPGAAAGRRAPAPSRTPAGTRFSFHIRRVTLSDVDLTLDFSTWALTLHGTSAVGSLRVEGGAAEGSPLRFEVGEIDARHGGSLRVGTRGHEWAALVPFDEVRIDRFAVDPAAPADLLLDVGRAATGRSVLSGRARFRQVFPGGRRAPPPGMDLDARWTAVGDAVEALKRVWGLSARVPGRLDGNLSVQVDGPFSALAGRLAARGAHVEIDLALTRELGVDGRVRLDGVDTIKILPRSLVPSFGGRLTGEVHAHGRLAPRPLDVAATLDRVTLRLDRVRRGPWPRRFVLSTGAGAFVGALGPGEADELDVFLAGVRLARGVLEVADVRAHMARARLEGAVSLRLVDARTGQPLATPLLEASGETRGLDIGETLPGWPVDGRLSLRGSTSGHTDDLAVRAELLPDTDLRLWGRPLDVPRALAVRIVDGERLVVPPVRLGLPPDGSVTVRGSLVLDGTVAAQLAIQRYRLEGLPPLPGLGVPVGGWLDAGLRLEGSTEAPRLAGEIAFSDVAVGGVVLGDGGLTLAPVADGVRLDGRLVPALGIHGRAQLGPHARVAATLDLHQLPLAPLLARVAPGVRGALSGRADLESAGGEARGRAVLDQVEVALTLPGGTPLSLRNEGPAQVGLAGGVLTVAPLALRGPGLDVSGQGTLAGAEVHAEARARVALRDWAAALRPWLREADGGLEVAVQADGPVARPALRGWVRAREPLRLWPAPLLLPLAVTGEVAFVGPALEAQRLTVSAAGATLVVDGQAQLRPDDWPASALDARVLGILDGAALSRRLPLLVPQAHGGARLDGRVVGSAGAPRFDGELVFTGLGGEVVGLPAQLRSLDGRVVARGPTLTTTGLSATLAPRGTLAMGSPEEPAMLEIDSLQPLALGPLAVRLRGHDLAALAPVGGVRLDDLDLDLRLAHRRGGPLRIGGDVWIDSAAVAVTGRRRKGAAAPLRKTEKLAESLFPSLVLDLGVHAPRGGIEVQIPYAPDLSLTVDCRLSGTDRDPRLSGRTRGQGLYSRLALFFFDVFSGAHIRRCGAGR